MPASERPTAHKHGSYGEDVAADYLRSCKFKILHRNFKTERYEIDIIAKQKRRLYFIEVKYRSSSRAGKGHEYITPTKLRQMTYAAEHWVAEQKYRGPYQLAVVSVDDTEVSLIDDIWP